MERIIFPQRLLHEQLVFMYIMTLQITISVRRTSPLSWDCHRRIQGYQLRRPRTNKNGWLYLTRARRAIITHYQHT